ncbi:MAG: metallophosphoesterase family protein [Clostridia bacterium]|nr:metallophosphoesterase family protein [Clostridia bacterium]
MKFLYFTDTHIRGNNPKNRKDNFYETLKNKFNEVKEIAKVLNVDYILHGGDWFERPDISPSIVREFAMIVRGFEQPIYTVAGNHDVFGHNPETIGRTMLGLLEGIGIMKLMGYEDEIILEKDGLRVQLTGKPYNYEIDGENFRKYYIVKKREDVDFAINIVHGMLLNKPFYEGIRYTLIDDIKDTEADITIAGHYHNGFGIKKLNEKYFVNPGSLVRVSNTLSEINRKPKVVLIELDRDVHLSEIELKCALPGDEVLDRMQLENSQDRLIKLHQFYQGVAASGEYKKMDIHKMIEEIASNQELSEKVRDEALRRIALASENLSSEEEGL